MIIIKRILTWILALLKYYNGPRELVRRGTSPLLSPSLPSCLISFPKLMHLKFGLACNLPIEKIHTYFVTKRQRASQENLLG
jgi:hypothetical protein